MNIWIIMLVHLNLVMPLWLYWIYNLLHATERQWKFGLGSIPVEPNNINFVVDMELIDSGAWFVAGLDLVTCIYEITQSRLFGNLSHTTKQALKWGVGVDRDGWLASWDRRKTNNFVIGWVSLHTFLFHRVDDYCNHASNII